MGSGAMKGAMSILFVSYLLPVDCHLHETSPRVTSDTNRHAHRNDLARDCQVKKVSFRIQGLGIPMGVKKTPLQNKNLRFFVGSRSVQIFQPERKI